MLRSILYVIVAIVAVLLPELVKFSEKPPRNEYEIAAVTVACIGAGANALIAYIDQHRSRQRERNKQKELQNETNTTQS